jgi:two-component system, chemotaxis family, CheB/CheR fusion protein
MAKSGQDKDEAFYGIISLLKEKAEIDISQYKPTTIGRRIQRQMGFQKIENPGEFLKYLEANPSAVKALADDIFIHVTEFFRDAESFQALKENIFPRLIKNRNANANLRLWIPGCSTGEEAYSLAIALFEFREEKNENIDFQIFATDISEQAIEKARSGHYNSDEVDGLSPKQLDKFMERVKDGYKMRKSVRDVCIFSKHDLTRNPPFAKIDLLSCRNVLIYFDHELQKQVMPIFHYSLNADGFLWLGRSEIPTGVSKFFSLIDKTHKIFSRISIATPVGFRFPKNRPTERSDAKRPSSPGAALTDYQREIDRIGFSKYAPTGVVVNTDMEVIQVRGHTAPFLELPSGNPSYNFFKMVKPELLPGIRMAFQAAQKTNAPTRKEDLTYVNDSERRKVNVEVIPVNPQAAPRERHYLIFFEEQKNAKKKSAGNGLKKKKIKSAADDASKDSYIAELLQEIDSMRDYQQTMAEGYEATREELTSSNEELQSTLEEFQSTNEELETAKEEMQATNEELETLNEELNHRNDELAKSEERFRLMVEGVKDYAIFMLDPEGKVATWNEGARRIKGYEPFEIVGRHFSIFYLEEDRKKDKPGWELERATTIGKLEDYGWRVRKNGTKFWANVIITRINDKDGNLIGFSKVTRDLTERRLAEDKLIRANEDLEARVQERTAELAESLKVRDEFLSVASHELKTPLTSLKLQLQITDYNTNPEKNISPTPQELSQSLRIALRQVDSLTNLIENLLDISRVRTGRFTLTPVEVDLSELTKIIVDHLSNQIVAAKIKIELRIENGIKGFWDRHRLEQVITNLLTNAVKYAPASHVVITTKRTENSAFLEVQDTGPGIPADKLTKVFERFERAGASQNVAGLGLGLFIAKKIVESHRGNIQVKSELRKGTQFLIELPLKPNYPADDLAAKE